MRWRFSRWAIVIAIVVLAVFVGGAVVTYINTSALMDDQAWVAHTLRVLARINGISAHISEAEAGQRGFLLTGDARYIRQYRSAADSIPPDLQQLALEVADNPSQAENFDALQTLVTARLRALQSGLDFASQYGGGLSRPQFAPDDAAQVGDIDDVVDRMLTEENRLLVQRTTRSRRTARRTLAVVVLSSAAGILLLGFVAFLVMRSVRERLASAQRLAESEEHLHLALHSANAWSWQYDIRTGAMTRSQDISRFLGLPPGTIGKNLESSLVRYYPQDAERFRRDLARTIESGAEFDDELRVVWPDGTVHWFAVRGRAVFDQQNRPLHVVGIDIEITDKKRQEEVMRETEKLASAGRLAATLAHEINNPLEAVNSIHYLLLKHGHLDPDTRQHLEIANHEMSRAIEVIRNTLGLYRDATVPLAVDLSQVVDNVLSLFDRTLRVKRIEIHRRYDTDGSVYGYRGEIRQIFINLISNALDAMSDGGSLTIHLADSFDWRNGGRPGVRATIADTGCGIPPEVRRRLFNPFFSTKGEKGTGLGLWVTRQLVEKHGGTIRLWSRVGRNGRGGTWFSVFLPHAEESSIRMRAR